MREFFQLSSPQFCPSNTRVCLGEYSAYHTPSPMDTNMHHFEFFPPVTADSMNFDEYSPLDFEELELIWGGDIDQNGILLNCPADKCSLSSSTTISSSVDAASSSTTTTMDAGLIFLHHQPLILPTENMEVDNQLIVHHLAKAYKEAMENKEAELAGVIAGRICEKVSPVGDQINERLLYFLFQSLDKESEYLKQESAKNYDRALEAFYRIFPYGIIPHFAANSAILEAKPHDAMVLHIVDFDMGEGVQWSSMIMALGQQQKELQAQQYYFGLTPLFITLKLTAIKWKEEDNSSNVPPWRRFEETKKRLQDCANIFCLMLEVREIELQDLVDEIKGMRRGGRREWLAFNCMWAIPHMGRKRSRRHVLDFVRTAKDLLVNSSCGHASDHNGILTFGDGGAWELFKGCPNFGAFLDKYMEHYQALLESIEWNFPICFEQARMSMECLFVAPYVSSSSWAQNWEEIEEVCDFRTSIGLEGLRVSSESIMEAKEIAREGETLYGAKIGENHNEIVLEWREKPLVRVSVWR